MNSIAICSDLICPWCYIGKRRTEEALRQLAAGTQVARLWHPFQLDPDLPQIDQAVGCKPKQAVWTGYADHIHPVAETDRQTFQDKDMCQAIDILLIGTKTS